MIVRDSISVMDLQRLLPRIIFVSITILSVTSYVSRAEHQLNDQEGSGSDGFMSSGDYSGSGSGSGSGEFKTSPTKQPDPLKCVLTSDSDSLFYPTTQDEVVLEAKCRSLCIEKVSANQTGLHNLVNTDGFFATVSTESLRSNCNVYQKIYQCTVGCQMGGDSERPCSTDCYDSCYEGLPGLLPNSPCSLTCSRAVCNIGCGLYEELNALSSKGPVPEYPPSFAYLVEPHSSPYVHAPATFNITFKTDDAPSLSNRNITAFVVQVSTDEHTTHYFLPSFDALLMIDSSLACRSAHIQFLAVNKFGPAEDYVYNTSLFLYGEVWPRWPDHPQPYSMGYTMAADTRDGYWLHNIVNITWNAPYNDKFLTSYSIQIQSEDEFNCGQSLEITDIQTLRFAWQASIPADGPIGGCNYDIMVMSNPHNSTYPGTPDVLTIPVETLNNTIPTGFIEPVDIKCYFQDSTGNFLVLSPRMEWTLPSNPILLQGIKEFKLNLSGWTVDDNGTVNIINLENDTIQFTTFQNKKSQTVGFNTSYKYTMFLQELTIIYEPDSTQYLNTTHSCYQYLVNPPPVSMVTANDIFIDQTTGDLRFNVTWEEPMFSSSSRIKYYLVCVGQTVQTNTTLSENDVHFLFSTESFLNAESTISIQKVIESPKNSDRIWYIQVQSVSNIGLKGVWSPPYIFDPATSEFEIILDLSCTRHNIDLGTSTYITHGLDIKWNVSSAKLEGLKGFELLRMDVGDLYNNTDSDIVEYEYPEQHYQRLFDVNVHKDFHFHYYKFEVKLLFKRGYPDRNPVNPQYCVLDGSLSPPSPIDSRSMQLDNFEIDKYGRLNISVNWPQPEFTNGGIRDYWIYIGSVPLSGTVEPEDYVLFVKDLLYPSFDQPSVAIGNQLLSQFGNKSSWIMYLQVLSVNNLGVSSNWTTPHSIIVEAFEIERVISSSSTIVPSPTETKKPTDTSNQYQFLVPVMSAIIPLIFVLTVAIILVLILLFIAYCQKKKIGNREQKSLMVGGNQTMDAGYLWERFPSDIEKMLLVGEGTFGEVYSGVLHQVSDIGKRKFDNESVNVFIATLKVTSSEDDRYGFLNLLEKHKSLSGVEHPFFLSFQGCVTCSQPYYLMTDFAENGDLLTFLQNHKKRLSNETASIAESQDDKVSSYLHYQHPSVDNLYPVDLLNYSRQIASAMDCLAGHGVVHGDLACRNIYVDQNFNLKVADFGIVNNGHREMIYVRGVPVRWASPKVLVNRTYSTSSDVWAFGVTVWEIITLGDFPYQDIRNEDLLKSITEGTRLPKPNNCSPLFYSILSSCWNANPKQRPLFETLHETFLNQLSKNETSSLITMSVSTQEPHPSYDSDPTMTQTGTQSPTSDNSSDSAISDDHDLGVVVRTKNISATNPRFSTIHKGFVNPGYRRSSARSINLDSPSFQIFQSKPTTTITKKSATLPLTPVEEREPSFESSAANTTSEV